MPKNTLVVIEDDPTARYAVGPFTWDEGIVFAKTEHSKGHKTLPGLAIVINHIWSKIKVITPEQYAVG